MSPQLFIGSSVENLRIAYAVQENLEHDAQPTVWTQGVFSLSASSIDSLVEALSRSDFGVFIFSPDDVTKLRNEDVRTVRDNVIFELGLFVGRLGKERTYIIVPRDIKDFHLPTDMLGMTPASYDANRSDKNWTAALGPACSQVRNMMEKLGSHPSPRKLKSHTTSHSLTDDEIIAILQSWMGGRSDQKNTEVIYFAKVDEELALVPGSAQKHLEAAAARYNYVVDRKGPSLVLFRHQPPPPPPRYARRA